MGRFASTVDFYSRYREPYLATFFETVAIRLTLRGNESLLDIGCGPGLLAIGFAPFVGHVTGLDPEPAMIEAGISAAAEAGLRVSFVTGRIEEFTAAATFDIITIGRALHWLERDAALPVLERIVAPSGRILICRASMAENPRAPWAKTYNDVRHSYPSETDKRERRVRLDPKTWFLGSPFHAVDNIEVGESREVGIADLVGRALSSSRTSPAILGDRRAAFEADITAALEPFAQRGVLREEIVARAVVFARSGHD